jgi:hypothetical protein
VLDGVKGLFEEFGDVVVVEAARWTAPGGVQALAGSGGGPVVGSKTHGACLTERI